MQTKQCKVCGKDFGQNKTVSDKTWNKVTKYCSKDCQILGVGIGAGKRFSDLNKSRIGIPIRDDVKKKINQIRKHNWYQKNKDRLSQESRHKYLNESLERKERRKILMEARDKIPGYRESRLAYHIQYRKAHSQENKQRNQTDGNKYSQYAKSAQKRNYEFSLSYDLFVKIFHSSCTYCDKENCRGIDRVDNSLGYTLENSFPCCEMCNRMKWRYTKDEFINHMIKIHKKVSKESV